jgi:hypothetical protein
MVKVVCDKALGTNLNALPPPGPVYDPKSMQQLWPGGESAHYGEACPLRELEMAFLSADWFMVFSEATS